jgi:hypothetical protein
MKIRSLLLAFALVLGLAAAARAQYTLTSGASNLVLEAFQPDVLENGCRTQLGRDQQGTHQQWQIEPAGRAGLYRITNVASGLALDAHLFDVMKNDCRIHLWQLHGGRNQLWRIESLGGDLCRISNAASGKVLAAHLFAVNRPGCRIQLWDDLEMPNQQWRIPGLFAGAGGGDGGGDPNDPGYGGGDPNDPGAGGGDPNDPGYGGEEPMDDSNYGPLFDTGDPGYSANDQAQPCPMPAEGADRGQANSASEGIRRLGQAIEEASLQILPGANGYRAGRGGYGVSGARPRIVVPRRTWGR